MNFDIVVYSYNKYASVHICLHKHSDTMIWRRSKTSFKKYTSHFIVKFAYERELETEQNCNILTPTLMAISVVSFSFSRAAQPEAQRPTQSGVLRPLLLGGGFPCHILSPTSLLQLTDFLSSPSYIIVQSLTQSPTQSLEWHVWSSSSGNNCHAVHRSLSSGASVYECIMGFYLGPFRQPNLPTRLLLITAIGMCHFLPVHHFGMPCLAGSKVNMQQRYSGQ